MTHAELVALLERERVRDFDALPQERHLPSPVERVAGYGLVVAYLPVTAEQAAENARVLDREVAAFEERGDRWGSPAPVVEPSHTPWRGAA